MKAVAIMTHPAEKPTHSINQVSGPAGVSESSVVSAEATIQLPSVSKVLDSEEAASELQKKLENLHVPPRQHVILPNHILVPESEKSKFSYKDCGKFKKKATSISL